jgi:hypothetical protein
MLFRWNKYGWQSFIAIAFLAMACDADHGMMHGNGFTTMSGWNWPIIIGIGFGMLLGYVIWLGLHKKKR